MPINPDLMPLYPGGSIRSREWQDIRKAALKRTGGKCAFCGVEDRSRVCRNSDGHFMTFDGSVFHGDTGQLLARNGINSFAGRMVEIIITVAHLDHDPTNNHPDNLKALCQQCHLRYDREHHRQTRRRKKAVRDLFDEVPA